MSESLKYCFINIKRCAKVVSIAGMIISLLIFGFSLSENDWILFGISFIFLITYIFVFFGALNEMASYMVPALIVLALNIIAGLSLAVAASVIQLCQKRQIISYTVFGIMIFKSFYSIFVFVVIFQTRQYFLSQSKNQINVFSVDSAC
uniref:NADH dehydrogenase subunit 6 n=1 Tax=Panagrolaimus sp. PS1159 TaxID=55785 RepID=A0AC35GAW2_9BILA